MASASDLIKLQGYNTAISGLNQLYDQWTTSEKLIVGTPVEYAIFVHEGTSKMEGRPFMKDAVEEVAKNKGDAMAEKASTGDELLLMIGLEVEAETKQKITDYDAIDSGDMRGGVAVIKMRS